LRVRAWNGNAPARVGTQPRLELTDGRALEGEIASATGETIALRPGAEGGAPLAFPFSDVESIVFSPESPVLQADMIELAFADATQLGGQLLGIKDGRG